MGCYNVSIIIDKPNKQNYYSLNSFNMVRIEDCETLNRARVMTKTRGLDPRMITCPGCVDGTDCSFNRDGGELPADYAQNIRLVAVEGLANVDKFYKKIEKHFKIKSGRQS